MRSNYVVNDKVRFNVLSSDQCQEIMSAVYDVLEYTGTDIYSEEALSLLKKAGCHVEGNHVNIPSALVKKALHTAPSRITICDREGNRKMFLEGYNFYFGPGPTNPYIVDSYTGERRKTTKKDVENVARLVDYLPNLDFVMSLAMIADQNPLLSDVHEVEAMLNNTTKPIVGWGFDIEGYRYIIDMCVAVAGSLEELQKRPFIILYSEPTTPLTHSKEAMDKLLFMAERKLPVIYTPAPQAAATAPATLAGTLVVATAECLAGLVVSQLKQEGAPFIMGGVITNMDLSTTTMCYGSPEFSLLHAAYTDVAHYLQLPMFSTAGCTDSKVVDEQAALEAGMNVLMAALSGANLIHDVGFLEGGLSGSMEQIVLGNEAIGMAKRIVRGITVSEETLALGVIDRVGPGGHFLGEEHTFNHFRKEFWFPSVVDRQRYNMWEASGSLTLRDRLNAKVKEILQTHEPKPLPAEVREKIRTIVERAEQDKANARLKPAL